MFITDSYLKIYELSPKATYCNGLLHDFDKAVQLPAHLPSRSTTQAADRN